MPTVPRVKSLVGRRMNSLFCCARKNTGKLRVHAVIRAMVCSATWSANTPEALVTMISEAMTDGRRQWSMPAAED